jgi:hypothetical protein
MKNFVFIYYNPNDMSGMPMDKVNAAWMSWFQQLGDKVVDAGNPFNSGGKAVEKSGVTTIENYPATGYTIVKANNIDEATEMAKTCPILEHSEGSAVRVYETMPM